MRVRELGATGAPLTERGSLCLLCEVGMTV